MSAASLRIQIDSLPSKSTSSNARHAAGNRKAGAEERSDLIERAVAVIEKELRNREKSNALKAR